MITNKKQVKREKTKMKQNARGKKTNRQKDSCFSMPQPPTPSLSSTKGQEKEKEEEEEEEEEELKALDRQQGSKVPLNNSTSLSKNPQGTTTDTHQDLCTS